MRLSDFFWTIIAFASVLIFLIILNSLAEGLWLQSRFWLRYGRRGKYILFVYSNSPNWKDYIESNILPRIEGHAVILNWSEHERWNDEHPFEAKLFGHWADSKEFNPVAIIFPPVGQVKVIRFWQAFQDYKHGKEQQLKLAEEALFKEIIERASDTA